MSESKKYKILSKYIKGSHSLNDYLKIKGWFKNDSDFDKLKPVLEEKWDESAGEKPEKFSSQVFDKINEQINLAKENKKKTIHIRNIFIRVAAALVIGLMAGYFVASLKNVEPEPVYFTARAPLGSISETILPDGTLIILNSGSKLQYTVEDNNEVNEVSLNGEAWFDVNHNPERIFTVKTSHYHVNVLGTQFNVKAYDEDKAIATTLENGKVTITSSEKLKLAYSSELKPGEQFLLNKETKSASLRAVNTKAFTAWKDNKLIFINMDLKELFVLLERKFGVDIEVESQQILDYHYTGTIKNETILEILDLISLTLPLEYKIIGQKIEITKTK